MRLGRWCWIGHGTKIRAHEGEVEIGAKTVMGQECTISAFQHVAIGRECIVADRVMLIDFDHGVVEVERPIRLQGIYKRDVRVGHNCWIGYGACILRGVTVGDNSIVGTSAVVTKDLPANSVERRPARPHPADARRAGDAALAGLSASRTPLAAQAGQGDVPRWAYSLAAIASCSASGAAAGSPLPPRSPPGRAGELVLAAVAAVDGDRGRVAAGLALGDAARARRAAGAGRLGRRGRRGRREAEARERRRAGDAVDREALVALEAADRAAAWRAR